MRKRLVPILSLLGFFGLLQTSCQRPLDTDAGRSSLPVAVEQAIARELQPIQAAEATETTVPVATAAGVQGTMAQLASRREELDAISPPLSAEHLPLGLDLNGAEQQKVELTRLSVIDSAITRNFGIQISQLQPQITAEDVIAAEAVFDAVLFSNVNMQWTDEPQRVPVLMGLPLGTPFNTYENYRFETGVRKRFTPGTQVFVSTDLSRYRNRSTGIVFLPDPAYNAAVRVGASQPLLRGFGDEVNTANTRLARNAQTSADRQTEKDFIDLTALAENAYWDLDAAWRELAIAQWLVDVGVKVRDVMDQRRDFDARPAQYSDAVARVEQRQADVIRARRAVRIASDALKAIMNDPQIPVASEAVLHPTDEPIETTVTFDMRETILSAVERRPDVRQAVLAIDDAVIRQKVADNQRLPLLDLSAQAVFLGLDDHVGGAYSQADRGTFIDYILGLAFEWPLGNRAANAGSRAARLRRSAATFNYEQTLQNVILEVKNALRDVTTNAELIRANRSFRIAQAENLRTLLIEEDLLVGLTPEFLNLKFSRQETLAQARRQEVQAIANFNKSLATLRRATGQRIPGS